MSAVTFTSEDPLGALTVDNPPLNLVSHETMGAPENAIIAAATRGRSSVAARAGLSWPAWASAASTRSQRSRPASCPAEASRSRLGSKDFPYSTVAAVRGCLPGPGRMTRLGTLLADRTVRAVADLHEHLGVLHAAIDTHRQALSA